jgi:kinesin family protein 15
MQDDVNFLRGVIHQLRDELQRMKNDGNNPTNPNVAYSTAWNARRSLNLLRSFGLGHPRSLPHEDNDGDIEMEIDEAAVERLCVQVGLQSSLASEGINHDMNRVKSIHSSDGQSIEKRLPEDSDVAMEDACCHTENHEPETVDNMRTETETGIRENQIKTHSQTLDHESSFQPLSVKDALCSSLNKSEDVSSCPDLVPQDVTSANVLIADGVDDPEHLVNSASPSLCIDPVGATPVLKSPTLSVSPTIRNSRKSLKTSELSTASQKDSEGENLVTEAADPSPATSKKMNNCSSALSTQKSKVFPVRTERLASSLHKGIKLLESYCQSTAQRRSTYRFSFKAPDSEPSTSISKADAGVQTIPGADAISEENTKEFLCCKCKCREQFDAQQMGDMPNLQLVPVDNSEVAEKSKNQVPKAVEKVLAGSIRREMALEEFCTKQASEITQLNRLVQQYKHERECNAIIGQTREDKIIRLESLMDGVLSKEDFLDEEFASLLHEHKVIVASRFVKGYLIALPFY